MTVCNRYRVENVENYLFTYIYNVSWQGSIETTLNDGLVAANKFHIYIPLTAKFGREYTFPINWENINPKGEYCTLRPGDLVVKGLVKFDDNPHKADLEKNYEYVCTIVGISDCRYGSPALQHWEVVAK
jgi:hypothetical protein